MIALAGLAAALAATGIAAVHPRPSLSASPTHLTLGPGVHQVVRVAATGEGPLVVHASVAGLALDLHGRPTIVGAHDATPWVSVHPRIVTVGRSGAELVVSSRIPRGASSGDHSALVLLTATTRAASGVAVRMRIGLAVSVRAPGRVVRRLAISRLRVRGSARGRVIELTIANRGNVIESLSPGRLRATLLQRGHIIARLHSEPSRVLPHAAAVVRLRCRGRLHGLFSLRVELSPAAPRARRTLFHLRL